MKSLLANPVAALRSFLTTIITVGVGVGGLAAALPAGGPVSVPADWLVMLTLVVGAARTLIVALNPSDPSYGVGASDAPVIPNPPAGAPAADSGEGTGYVEPDPINDGPQDNLDDEPLT